MSAPDVNLSNASSSSSDAPLYYTYQLIFSFKLVFYVLLMAVTIVGNSFILFVLFRQRKQFNFWRVNLFIFHLAIGDLLVALTSMSVNLISVPSHDRWLFGSLCCKAMAFIQVVAPASTSFLLVSMACDRYRAVVTGTRSKHQIYGMICCSWLLSVLISVPQIYGWGIVVERDGSEYCDASMRWMDTTFFKAYLASIFMFIVIIPTVTNVYCYGKIIICLFYKPKPPSQPKPLQNQTTIAVVEKITNARKKMTKLALTIVVCYLVCWLPYFLVAYLSIFVRVNVPWEVMDLVEGLALANSMVNPFIYGKFTLKREDVSAAFNCCNPQALQRISCLGFTNTADSQNETYDQHFALKLQQYRERRPLPPRIRVQEAAAAAAGVPPPAKCSTAPRTC